MRHLVALLLQLLVLVLELLFDEVHVAFDVVDALIAGVGLVSDVRDVQVHLPQIFETLFDHGPGLFELFGHIGNVFIHDHTLFFLI